jgi:hypothetical protein
LSSGQDWNLTPNSDYLRHYDITGKICPKPWVDYVPAWEQFKKDVKRRMDGTDLIVPLDPGVAQTNINTWIKPEWKVQHKAGNTD